MRPYAGTVIDHAKAFSLHSRYPVVMLNVRDGFPPLLDHLEFDVVVLHYSLFGTVPYELHSQFADYVRATEGSYRVAFFQDEYRFCQERLRFLSDVRIDTIYTLQEPDNIEVVYRPYVTTPQIIWTLPGLVPERIVEEGRRLAKPDEARTIDIGYRGRPLPHYLGAAGVEKYEIATEMNRRLATSGLSLDISARMQDRIYGQDWLRFLGNSRAVLGVEGGASTFDLDGEVYACWERIMRDDPEIDFAGFRERAGDTLARWDWRYPSLMMTPRIFEAAALRACLILFEGRYSGILKPMRHYIPLRKDYSNLDEVVDLFRQPDVRHELVANAYADLIASGRFSYAGFVREFDEVLADAGIAPARTQSPWLALLAAQQRARDARYRTSRAAADLRTKVRGTRHRIAAARRRLGLVPR